MKTINFTTTLFASALFFSACQNSADKIEITANANFASTNAQANSVEPTNKRFESLAEKSKTANEQATRLDPSKFKDLPQEIINNLKERKCTVPQTWHIKTPHNVVSGEYSKKGQKDWAILCSINRVSSILIFWNGSTRNVAEIAKSDDLDYFQGVDSNNEMGFSRVIDTVDKKYIIDHYNSYGGVKPPQIDHEGINDTFAEKASYVLYLHRGKWLELQGAD
jgi:hypothetical protein